LKLQSETLLIFATGITDIYSIYWNLMQNYKCLAPGQSVCQNISLYSITFLH